VAAAQGFSRNAKTGFEGAIAICAGIECGAISSATGSIPLTPLADAIATTLAWHRAHPAFRLPL
jgi:hypothetical protein